MKLFIDGRDIREIHIGDIDTSEYKTYSTEPGYFLRSIDAFLQDCGKTFDSVEELHIMKGKGSATALRSALAIANTIQFVKHIPVYTYSVEKDRHIFEDIVRGDLKGALATGYVTPDYEYAPKITKTNKDRLKRKQ